MVDVDGTATDHELELEPAEYGLADDRWQKTCAWQYEDGRDLYCTAVHLTEETARVVYDLGGKGGYETDLGTCQMCAVPDERLLCAAFSHAKTYPKLTMGPGKFGHPEAIWSATCRLGYKDVENPGECRPGLNPCWHQTVMTEVWRPVPTDGLHLLEAFDFLDSEWRHRYPDMPLVVPTSIAEAAQLLNPVQTRGEFRDQVVRLGELLQKLRVDGNLFSAKAASGAIDRLGQWCEEHAPGGMAAVERLHAVNTLRNALAHTDPPKLERAFQAIGVPYPPGAWADAWQGVMAHVDTALRDLRREVRPGPS